MHNPLGSAFEVLAEALRWRQSLDLATKSNLDVHAKANDVEDFLAEVDADRGDPNSAIRAIGPD